MSRTFRKNKFGDIRTDKFNKSFNGCGCSYCEFLSKDFRGEHIKKAHLEEMKEGENYIYGRYGEERCSYDDEYFLDTESSNIMYFNNLENDL